MADRRLCAAMVTFDVVDPRSPAAIQCMTAYFSELDHRFPDGFDPGDALDAAADGMRAPSGAFVVGRSAAQRVACGGVVGLDVSTAEIKRMWVSNEWRGLGLGYRMLTELERHAVALGHRRVVLDTNATLTEAIAMYARAGYDKIERYNDNPYAQYWFEKHLRSSCV